MQGREPNCLTQVVRLRRDVSVELQQYDWLRGLTIRQHLDPFLLVVVLCWGRLVSGKLWPICIRCALACGVQVLKQTKKSCFNKHNILTLPDRGRHEVMSCSHLQFYCRRCSTQGPCSLGQAVQGSPRYGWRNPVSVPLMASSPCQLDDDHSKGIIV